MAALPAAGAVATSRYIAEDGCDLIEIEYEATPAVVDYRRAAAETERLFRETYEMRLEPALLAGFVALGTTSAPSAAASNAVWRAVTTWSAEPTGHQPKTLPAYIGRR